MIGHGFWNPDMNTTARDTSSFSTQTFLTVGIHQSNVKILKGFFSEALDRLSSLLINSRIAATEKVGLDHSADPNDSCYQMRHMRNVKPLIQ
ncbi:hypothetical protein DPMN_173797 [Dreissena polymorpha]|uniref:Uncharacterized protein n=1 Tax=Dreissena polymorpha TaxID=45954 RepID=A0A9D4E4N3_DREPO|nr:hypothetical protein DPMN_173727 [Dreissena polymorpha]KAH3772459.1 hypothetical protein DPMN_173797 [Dreissena polymorpha]